MKQWTTTRQTTIHKLNTIRSACFLIKNGNSNILVDTGLKNERKKIIRDLQTLQVYKLDAIVITHVHSDHCGNAAYLQNLFHCPIYGEIKEIELLAEGKAPISGGSNKLMNLLASTANKTKAFTSFESSSNTSNVKELMNDMNIHHLHILHTSGHTLGSISVIVDDEIALVGDAMVHYLQHLYPPFLDDAIRVKASWERLLSTGCTLFLPAHGSDVNRSLLETKFNKLK